VRTGAVRSDAGEELFEGLQRHGGSVFTYGGDAGPALGGAERKARIGCVELQGLAGIDMAGRDAELGMVEGRALEADAVVGEGFEKRYHRLAIGGIEIEPADILSQAAIGKVAAARVKVDDSGERSLAAIVEVRTGVLHVSKAGRFESALDDRADSVALRDREGLAECVEAAEPDIVGDGADAGAEVAGVGLSASAAGLQRSQPRDAAKAGGGEFGSGL